MSASDHAVGHTPGPWKRYEGYGVDFRRPVITDAIPDRDGKCVANCICYVATTNADWGGNVRLIAAAPDLLAACLAFIAADNQCGANLAFVMAQEAVKKAGVSLKENGGETCDMKHGHCSCGATH